jgi:hypothetical protein
MALPVIPDNIRVSVYGTMEGGVGWSNTFHLAKATGDTYTAAMADNVVNITKMYDPTGFGGTNFGLLHYATDGTAATQIVQTPLDGTTPSRTDSIALSGTSTQSALPAQTALPITFVTAKRGRSFRGRIFAPLNSREVINPDGRFNPADQAFIQSMLVALNTAFGAQTHPTQLHVASYKLVSSEAVVSFTCRLVYGHQTKRRGRGA